MTIRAEDLTNSSPLWSSCCSSLDLVPLGLTVYSQTELAAGNGGSEPRSSLQPWLVSYGKLLWSRSKKKYMSLCGVRSRFDSSFGSQSIASGQNTLGLLFLDRWLFGSSIFLGSNTLGGLFRSALSQNMTAWYRCYGENLTFGYSLSWCLSLVIWGITFGNSKCLTGNKKPERSWNRKKERMKKATRNAYQSL